MALSSQEQYERLRVELVACGQGHVLAFWDDLDEPERRALMDDLSRIHIAELPSLVACVTGAEPSAKAPDDRVPPEVLHAGPGRDDLEARGAALLAAGRVAALTVAGGEGTRLGFAGPKGAVPVSPVRRKPLFQLFAEAIRAAERRYGGRTPWYIMTSRANDEQTRAFFASHGFFGLTPEQVRFFQQGAMPAFSPSGKILLSERHRVALAPDGHGGCLLAMAQQGVLSDMAQRGVDYVSYFQVDNPLVHCVDPVFIGLHDLQGSEMSSKTVSKADDLERVGCLVARGGRLTVIEYSDMPESMARSRDERGARRFDAANIAIHILSRALVERLTADPAAFALPWHRAVKKVSHVDPETGTRVEPTEPNAIKLEAFVFDALPLARNPIVVATSREEEFSPVKNPDGPDSIETARRAMSRRAARWLEAAGVRLERDSTGEPRGPLEISPLFALTAADLGRREIPERPGSEDAWCIE
ncbi:MAG: UTP--glucose-1-phosphate uridylyltransferase [Phycisphaerae bacterium]